MKKTEVPKEFMERTKRFVIRPYGYILNVIVSTNIQQSYKRRMNSLGYREFENPYAFLWTRIGCLEMFAFLPETCGLGATAHEMLHAVDFVMNSVGAGYNSEVWAYHLEELTQMAAEFVHAKDPNKFRGKKDA